MTDSPHAIRHAVYFAPEPGSPWCAFGTEWLGGAERGCAGRGNFSAHDWWRMTEEPRRYGFHATLKAPFRLAVRASPAQLCERLEQLAGALTAVPLGALYPQQFHGFVALAPGAPAPALNPLAERCVIELDDLRAPLLPHELARRHAEQLDTRGRELLLRHGYPHVLERFRFHMTLAMCTEDLAEEVGGLAQQAVAPLNQNHPLVLDRLCLFEERGPGAPFQRVQDFVLGA